MGEIGKLAGGCLSRARSQRRVCAIINNYSLISLSPAALLTASLALRVGISFSYAYVHGWQARDNRAALYIYIPNT